MLHSTLDILNTPEERKISVITVLSTYRVSEIQGKVETINPEAYTLETSHAACMTIISGFNISFLIFTSKGGYFKSYSLDFKY